MSPAILPDRHCEERSNIFAMQIIDDEFIKERPAQKPYLIECPISLNVLCRNCFVPRNDVRVRLIGFFSL